MDVKSAFLNGYLNDEAYAEKPKGFQDPYYPDLVYKLNKVLYGLKQAPRAWYERLTVFLLENSFKRGSIDKTMFIKYDGKNILIALVYVDDIVFCSTSDNLIDKLAESISR